MDNKLTDNDIIKALECCSKTNCRDCPYIQNGNIFDITCSINMAKDALDLINRQNAEIERLQRLGASATRKMVNARAEAINAYSDEVRKRCTEIGIYPVIVKNIMEDVRKEMVGE